MTATRIAALLLMAVLACGGAHGTSLRSRQQDDFGDDSLDTGATFDMGTDLPLGAPQVGGGTADMAEALGGGGAPGDADGLAAPLDASSDPGSDYDEPFGPAVVEKQPVPVESFDGGEDADDGPAGAPASNGLGADDDDVEDPALGAAGAGADDGLAAPNPQDGNIDVQPTKTIVFVGRFNLITNNMVRHIQATAAKYKADAQPVGAVFAVMDADLQDMRLNPLPIWAREDVLTRLFNPTSGELKGLFAFFTTVRVPHIKKKFNINHKNFVSKAVSFTLMKTPQNTKNIELFVVGEDEAAHFKGPNVQAAPKWDSIVAAADMRAVVPTLETLAGYDVAAADHLCAAQIGVFAQHPDVLRRAVWLAHDFLLKDHGSLTEDRDYGDYAQDMGNNFAMHLKMDQTRELLDHWAAAFQQVRDGGETITLVDDGCADGALFQYMSRNHAPRDYNGHSPHEQNLVEKFKNIDFFGVEISAEMSHRFREAVHQGYFGAHYANVVQANLLDEMFEPESVEGFMCLAVLHELYSYIDHDGDFDPATQLLTADGHQRKLDTIKRYFANKFAMLKPNGYLMIRDVIGVNDGDEEVVMVVTDASPENKDAITYAARGGGFLKAGQEVRPADLAAGVAAGGLADIRAVPDPVMLTPMARFLRYAMDHKYKFHFTPVALAGVQGLAGDFAAPEFGFRMKIRHAIDYMATYEYTGGNWDSEMNELFTFTSYEGYTALLKDVGFVIESSVSGAQHNDWLVRNRFQPAIALYRLPTGSTAAVQIPFSELPPNVVIGARKPVPGEAVPEAEAEAGPEQLAPAAAGAAGSEAGSADEADALDDGAAAQPAPGAEAAAAPKPAAAAAGTKESAVDVEEEAQQAERDAEEVMKGLDSDTGADTKPQGGKAQLEMDEAYVATVVPAARPRADRALQTALADAKRVMNGGV